MQKNNKSQLIKIAAIISLSGNALLALLKITAGLYAHSNALIGDGIDSTVDVLTAVITLVVARIISRPADKEHPWGHGRAETIGTTILSCLIFFAGAQVIVNSITTLLSVDKTAIPSTIAIIVSLISISGKLILSLSQYMLGKRAQSSILKANAKNMAGDVIISLGVLIGISLSVIFSMPIFDPIVAMLVGLWVIKSGIAIFIETNMELMDGNADTDIYKTVFDAVNSVHGAINPHRTRMRRIAGFWDIDIDIEVEPHLTIEDAHKIASAVERAIKMKVENIYDIMVHVEPKGDKDNDPDEGYGLSAHELMKNTGNYSNWLKEEP